MAKDDEKPFAISIGMFNQSPKNKVIVLLYGHNNLHVASPMIGCMYGMHALVGVSSYIMKPPLSHVRMNFGTC